jgi:hypothetical protein
MAGKEIAGEVSFQWILDKHFLVLELVGKDKSTNEVVAKLYGIGGWCPIAKKYREWGFGNDGSFSDTVWTAGADGRRTGQLSGVSDGQPVKWVNERKLVDHDTMTGVIRDLAVEKKLSDTPYKMCRQKKVEAKAGPEITLDEALKTWKFLEGDWVFTSPDGKVENISVRRLQCGGYITEGAPATHVFGWNPSSKRLEIQSYLPDGGRGVATYDRQPDGRIAGKGTLTEQDGSTTVVEGAFSGIAADRWQFSIGEQTWTAKRK